MAPRRSSAIIPAGSSTSRFRSAAHATYYQKLLAEKITISKTLDQSRLRKYQVAHLFHSSSLGAMLRLAFPFNREFVYELYANMEIPFSREVIRSRVMGRDIELTRQDFHEFLGLSMTGHSVHNTITDSGYDWATLNLKIRGTPFDAHVSLLDGVTRDARIVQHILRSSVYPKVGDKTSITPTLSVSTYFILEGEQFDETDAIIRYIEDAMAVRLAHVKRKKNLVLGHVLSYLVYSKYQFRSPDPCDAEPCYFSDFSFNILFSEKRAGAAPPAAAAVGGDPEGEGEEPEQTEAPRPTVQGEASSSRASTFDYDGFRSYLDERFDSVEAHYSRVDSHLQSIDGRLDRIETSQDWLRAQYESQLFPPSAPTDD